MVKKFSMFGSWLAISAVAGIQLAAADESSPSLEAPALLRGVANWEFGQIEEGFSTKKGGRVDREFLNRSSVWLWSDVQLAENAKATLGVGGVYFFVFPRNLGDNPYVFTRRSGLGLTEASLEVKLAPNSGDGELANLKAGIFQYKANPNSQNLGEYLFRTWTYPNIITTGGFDIVGNTSSQLSGAMLKTLMGGFQNDLLLTIQSDRPPIYGLSLTDVMAYSMGAFRISAGVMWDNFYVPEAGGKVPKIKENNRYYTLSNGRKLSYAEYNFELGSGLIDPAVTPINDTSYYSFEGIKPIWMASLDIQKLLGMDNLGPAGVYYEGVLMGIEDRPTYFEKTSQRMAHMFGANIPTFGLLDQVSFEAEMTSNPFRNSTNYILKEAGIAPPVGNFADEKEVNYKKDDFKWSLLASKKIYPKANLMVQVANDHLRTLSVFSEWEDLGVMQQSNHWYWACKMQVSL